MSQCLFLLFIVIIAATTFVTVCNKLMVTQKADTIYYKKN